MKDRRVIGAGLVALALVGCADKAAPVDPVGPGSPRAAGAVGRVRAALAAEGPMEIFALDPHGVGGAGGRGTMPLGHLQGYEILSRVEVADAAVRGAIARLIAEGLLEDVARRPDCFNPRHGVRLERGGTYQELLLCYECTVLLAYEGGRFLGSVPTGDGPLDSLNRIWAGQGCREEELEGGTPRPEIR